MPFRCGVSAMLTLASVRSAWQRQSAHGHLRPMSRMVTVGREVVRRKGGAIDVIVWQTSTARLLPRLLKGRKSGPVFLTDRRARVELPPCDIDRASGKARLSYRQAENIFKEASGGATLHQLRHSALTHDEGRGVASDATFCSSREHALSAAQRAALRCPRPAGRAARLR